MKVFKLYLKIFRSYIVVAVVYIGIFLAIGIAVTSSQKSSSSNYVETRVNVVLENLDEGNKLSEGLKNYLSNFVDYTEMDKEDISDALYYRKIYSYIIIPENFEEDFTNGKEVKIVQERIEENATSVAIDRAINKYLNYIRVYRNQTDKDLNEVITLVEKVLETEVNAIALEEENDELGYSGFYYKTLSYVIISVVLTIVGLITISFRKLDVRRRLIVSPYSLRKSNLEIIFGNFLFTIVFVVLLSGVSFILYPNVMSSNKGLLLVVNVITFSLAALSMSYFMSLLIRNEQVLSGVNNVFSLGTSFLTGAFVPQVLLGKQILFAARIFPNYYYVYNVDLLTSTSKLNSSEINTMILYFIIQLAFSLVFVVLSILLSKKQAKLES